jgi:hypothetical protein
LFFLYDKYPTLFQCTIEAPDNEESQPFDSEIKLIAAAAVEKARNEPMNDFLNRLIGGSWMRGNRLSYS